MEGYVIMGYYRQKKSNKGKLFLFSILFIIMVAAICWIVIKQDNKKLIKNDSSNGDQLSSNITESSDQNSKATGFDEETIEAYAALPFFQDELKNRYVAYKEQHDDMSYEQAIVYVNIGLDTPYYSNIKTVSNAASITAIVNKYNGIGKYEPNDLVKISSVNSTKELYMRKEACGAFEKMCNDARTEGYDIRAMSAYRSYNRQNELYNNYVATDGKEAADTYSARPGNSEHQTGLAVDIQGGTTGFESFKTTKESKWINDNSYKYGFIVRYPEGKERITGYMAEAWHIRYVGKEIAQKIHGEKITFDEYYAKHLSK